MDDISRAGTFATILAWAGIAMMIYDFSLFTAVGALLCAVAWRILNAPET